MLAKMTRYRVIVLSLKPRRAYPAPADDEVFLQERDVFLGYSYKQHRSGKYFDLWFTNPKEKDLDNFVTFGRINAIVPEAGGKTALYVTKFGRFIVEEMSDETQVMQGEGTKGRKGSQRADHAVVPRADGGRRDRGLVRPNRGGPDSFRQGKGVTSNQH